MEWVVQATKVKRYILHTWLQFTQPISQHNCTFLCSTFELRLLFSCSWYGFSSLFSHCFSFFFIFFFSFCWNIFIDLSFDWINILQDYEFQQKRYKFIIRLSHRFVVHQYFNQNNELNSLISFDSFHFQLLEKPSSVSNACE